MNEENKEINQMELMKFDDFIKIINENPNKWISFTKRVAVCIDPIYLNDESKRNKYTETFKIIFIKNEDIYVLDEDEKQKKNLDLKKLELKFKNEVWHIEKNNYYITT